LERIVKFNSGFLQGGQLLGNEKLKRYYENLYVELNNGLQTLRKAALLTDPAFTGKVHNLNSQLSQVTIRFSPSSLFALTLPGIWEILALFGLV